MEILNRRGGLKPDGYILEGKTTILIEPNGITVMVHAGGEWIEICYSPENSLSIMDCRIETSVSSESLADRAQFLHANEQKHGTVK